MNAPNPENEAISITARLASVRSERLTDVAEPQSRRQ